ncbi:MAG: hypothetical protein ABJC09_00465 [Terriglobia bacterium]
MAGNTLTTLSSLQCPHGGTVTIVSSNSKVQAVSGFIATASDTFTIAGCPFQIPATPPIPSPCLTVQWIVSDLRVTVNSLPSVSQGSTGLCLNAQQAPQGPVVVGTAQAKVSSQ